MWHRRLGNLYQADVVSNAPETLVEFDDVCNVSQDHKDSSTKRGRDASIKEAGEGFHRRDGTFQIRINIRVPVLHWNDYDTTRIVNEMLEKCKCIPFMVSLRLIIRKFAEANHIG